MIRLAMCIALPCSAQVTWTSIGSYEYFKFWNDGAPRAIEKAVPGRANPHPPTTYRFFTGPTSPRTTCRILDRGPKSQDGPVYWYTPSGKHLDGAFPTPAPSEYNVSALQSDMRGFAVTASFRGTARDGNAVETAYFTDKACSDGGVEYGFARDLATNSLLVYWSTFANCGIGANSICRKTNNPALGENVQQEDSNVSDHGFRIYGLDADDEYAFRIYVDRGAFHVEVLHGARPAKCSEHDGGALTPCVFTKNPGAWFPIRRLERAAGYIVIGTQTAGNPKLGDDAGLRVSDVRIAK